jgi:hypothetical protein
MIANAYTNDATDTPNRITAPAKTGAVLFLNASLHPRELPPCFSRILLSTSMNEAQATTVIAAMKLKNQTESAIKNNHTKWESEWLQQTLSPLPRRKAPRFGLSSCT